MEGDAESTQITSSADEDPMKKESPNVCTA